MKNCHTFFSDSYHDKYSYMSSFILFYIQALDLRLSHTFYFMSHCFYSNYYNIYKCTWNQPFLCICSKQLWTLDKHGIHPVQERYLHPGYFDFLNSWILKFDSWMHSFTAVQREAVQRKERWRDMASLTVC